MIIHAQFKSFQKRRLPVISPADDQCNPFTDTHSRNFPSMRQVQSHLQFLRRLKLDAAFHRSRRNPGFPWQNAAIRHKGAESHLWKHFSDILLVFRQINDRAQALRIHVFIKEGCFYTLGNKVKKDFLQFPRIDSPSIRRESDLHPQYNIPISRIHPAGSPLQNFLIAAAHRNKTALP